MYMGIVVRPRACMWTWSCTQVHTWVWAEGHMGMRMGDGFQCFGCCHTHGCLLSGATCFVCGYICMHTYACTLARMGGSAFVWYCMHGIACMVLHGCGTACMPWCVRVELCGCVPVGEQGICVRWHENMYRLCVRWHVCRGSQPGKICAGMWQYPYQVVSPY